MEACGLAPIASHLISWDFPADKDLPLNINLTTEGPSEKWKWKKLIVAYVHRKIPTYLKKVKYIDY